MKYEYIHEIDVPFEEKTFILPQDRIKLFQNLVANYKVFLPGFELQYAYLNFDSSLPIDYLVIFTANTKKGDKMIVWDCPYLYSNKAIPAYRYIVRNQLHDQFFTFVRESMPRMEYVKFREFIPSNLCGLSFNEKSPDYWKNPDNAKKLAEAFVSVTMEYVPKPGSPGVRVFAHKKDLPKLNKKETP